MEKKFIQICSTTENDYEWQMNSETRFIPQEKINSSLYALRDDGIIFQYIKENKNWIKLPDCPQN